MVAAGGVIMLVPFLDMVVGALRTQQELVTTPPVFLPSDPQWVHYREVFQKLPMLRLFRNSLLIAGSVTLLVVLTSTRTGYPHPRPGR